MAIEKAGSVQLEMFLEEKKAHECYRFEGHFECCVFQHANLVVLDSFRLFSPTHKDSGNMREFPIHGGTPIIIIHSNGGISPKKNHPANLGYPHGNPL